MLEKTGMSDKVHSLKNGVNTYVYKNFDEEGFQPSGGEAQKIALCRAAFKDADIIILDEPTQLLIPKQRMRFITDLMKLQEDALPFILLTGWPVPGFVTGSLCLKREKSVR